MTIDEQIRRTAAAGVPHDEIATIFGVALEEIAEAIAAEQPEQTEQPVAPPPRERRLDPVSAACAQAGAANDALRAELASRGGQPVCAGFGPGPRRRIGPKLTDLQKWQAERAGRGRGGSWT